MMHRAIFAIGCCLSVAASGQGVTTPSPAAMAVRPGSWSYMPTSTGSEASFVDSTGTASLIVRCVRATRSVQLSVRGLPATALSVWTTSTTRGVAATFDPATSRVTAALAAGDSLLDAMVFSRGRFALTVPGLSSLVVPSWPEPARAVEDCRN